MDDKLIQLLNANEPMEVTPLGIVIEDSFVQLSKTPEPMVVILEGIVMDVNALQY